MLSRSDNKILGGVCAGIAEKLKWSSVRMLRTLFIILIPLTCGAICIFYAILWAIMPLNKKSRKSYEERMRDKLSK